MKRTLMCVAAALALSAAVNAAQVTCSSGPVSLTPGGSSPTLSCGGLTFSDFQLVNLSGDNSGRFDIGSISFDSITGMVTMAENPNLGNAGHEDLLYKVSGPVNSIGVSAGGEMATIIQRACANPIPTMGAVANLCSDTSQLVTAPAIATIAVHSGDVNQPVMAGFSGIDTIYVYKDIGVSTGGGLSSLTEYYGAALATPEPATALLLGAALAGLGLLRRKRRTGRSGLS